MAAVHVTTPKPTYIAATSAHRRSAMRSIQAEHDDWSRRNGWGTPARNLERACFAQHHRLNRMEVSWLKVLLRPYAQTRDLLATRRHISSGWW